MAASSPARPDRGPLLVERRDPLPAVLRHGGLPPGRVLHVQRCRQADPRAVPDGLLGRPEGDRDLAAICCASSSACWPAFPAGASRSARPIRSASSAVTWRPVKIRSMARPGPSLRCVSWVPPPPGTSPTVVSGRPNTAVSSATIRSQHRASSQPPPRAYPCTAAITGCGRASTPPNAARNTSRCASSPASDRRLRSFRSAPTQNARSPAADSTTARESLSDASSAQAWASLVAIAVSIAFSASGRSRMISQTPA